MGFQYQETLTRESSTSQNISRSGSTYLNRRACHHLSGASGEDPGLSDHLQHAGLPSALIPNNHHLKVKRKRLHQKHIIKGSDERDIEQENVQKNLNHFKETTKT